jgi:phage terminase large subunit GpA-like protein
MSFADRSRYIRAFMDGLKPDPILTVSQWADKHRVLSKVSSAESGQWKTSRTPFLREIMDSLSVTSQYTEVVFMKGTQVGGTECGNNFLGYIIDYAPGPVMSVMPRVEDAKKTSKTRIQPLIDESPRLSSKVKDQKARDSGNTLLLKEFVGGLLVLAGANSAAGLRSTPIRYLIFDEEDAFPGDVEGEGDPIDLAKKRTDTFSGKKKVFHISTPTIEDRSKIENNFQRTDQRKYYIPCPHCEHYQFLQWNQIKWESRKPETVYYECEECKEKIYNWQKTKMLKKGEWRATSESTSKKLIGFHLSGLYSPVGWFSWEDAVRQWEDAHYPQKNIEKLKTFVNTVLGETWKDKGEAPDWKKLYLRREDYKMNTLPNGVLFLTAGVDIQADRIECEIVGWGKNKVSWSIDYRVFVGDTSSIQNEPWIHLESMLAEVWETEGGHDLPIKMAAIDSGWNTQTVYSWVRKFPISRVVAIKGSDLQSTMISSPRAVDVKLRGKGKVKRGLKLFTVGVSIIKQELYGWLRQEPPTESERTPYGFCHFPEYDEEHFKRLTSETLETKWVKGKKKYEWVANGRNEQLDCRVYARAAASLIGIDRFKEHNWARLAAEVGVILEDKTKKEEKEPEEKEQKVKIKRTKVKIKRRKSSFT